MIIPAAVPASRGLQDAEWWWGIGLIYAQLIVVVAITEGISRVVMGDRRASMRGVLLGLVSALGGEWTLSSLEWLWLPEYQVYEGEELLTYPEVVAIAVLFGFVSFAIWVLAFRYPEFLARDAARAHEAERLRSMADRQELEARLAPHFLLNTLNAAAGLTMSEPETAREVLISLGELLRAALYHDRDHTHTVAQELTLTRSYTSILEARYGTDRLRFAWKEDPATEGRTLPPLLLQPLVENAVKHGALRSAKPSVVNIETSLDASGDLVLRVDNEGDYEPDPAAKRHGVDLVQRRLEFMGEGCALDIDSADGRTVATVTIPATASASP